MTSLDVLPKGFRFPPTQVDLPVEWVAQYLEATEDTATPSLAAGLAPPMALAALAIKTLLNNARLPEGAVHAGQELECLASIPAGEPLTVDAEIVSKGHRQGWLILTVAFSVEDAAARKVMAGRSTLSMPVESLQ